MTNSHVSDVELETSLIGKWRFETSWDKNIINFKDDMTYEQTKIQTFILSKVNEIVTGNLFTGVWYVNENILHLNVKTVPNSPFNFQIPLGPEIAMGNIVASLSSMFVPEKYKVIEINSSQFHIKDMDKSQLIIGAKSN